jgi:hypothetical protein
MGAHPYYYYTPYQQNVQEALDGLREQEFKAGRYDPAMARANPPSFMFQFTFPPSDASPAPGARHDTIGEAVAAGADQGTGSILDIIRITKEPDFAAANALSEDDLVTLFGTTEPTRACVDRVLFEEGGNGFWDQIGRGQGRYIVLYEGGGPREIFFSGFSLD